MFFGLANYFRKWLTDYADKAHALTKLLRKDAAFVWGEEQEQVFLMLKEALV